MIGSPAAIVLCNEIIGYVKRFIRGFDIRRELIGLDVIRKVGPGGNFLTEDQTLKYHLKEYWHPAFLDRDNPETWIQKGSKSYGEVVTQQAIEILKTHRPEELPIDKRQAVEQISKRASAVLLGKHIAA